MSDWRLDNLLKQRLQGFEVEPAEGAWEEIKAGIDQSDPKGGWYWKPIGGGILILLLIGSGFYYQSQGSESSDATQQTVSSASDLNNAITADIGDIIGRSDDPVVEHGLEEVLELDALSNNANPEQVNQSKDPSGPSLPHIVQTGIRLSEATLTTSSPNRASNQARIQLASRNNLKMVDAPKDYSSQHRHPLSTEGEAVHSDGLNKVLAGETSQSGSDRASLKSKEPEDANYVQLLDPADHPLEYQPLSPRDPDEITPSWSPWKLYFQAMPTLTYARITTNKIDDEVVTKTEEPSLVSTNRLGYRLEVGAQYQWRERIQLTSGLLYFSTNQKIEYKTSSLSSFDINTGLENQNFIASPEFDTLTQLYEYDLRNLGIQLGFNYKLGKGRLQHFIGSGVEFHKTLNNYATYGEGGELKAPSMYSFINFRYRLEYPISDTFDFYFQPMVNYTLFVKQGNTSAPFYVKPYGVGLNFGITYQFPGK